jgi:MFS family permease
MRQIPIIDTYITLVRNNPNYRYLWLSQLISQMGDWFNLIASAALIARLSGSGLAIGGLFIARLLPPFVLTPVVGVVADRFDRRKILIISDVLRVFVVLGFLVVRTEQQIWLLYALTVLQLSISAFFEPTRAALLPSLVAKKDLVTANALAGTTWSTMLAIGAALGGLATALLGITAAFLIDAATFILSAWFITLINLPSTDSGKDGETNQETGWYAFVDGLRYLHQRPAILIIALVKASAALAFGGMAVLEVTFAESYFPIGTDGSGTLGLIYLVAGLGTGLGPLVAQRITGDNPNAMKWTILLTYIAMIIGYGLMNRAFTLPLLLIATFVRTAGSGTSWVYSSALLQMFIPDKFLGRVFAFDFAMMTLAASTSTLWVGWARDSLGLDPYQISLALGFVPVVMSVGWLAYIFAYPKEQQALSL